MTSACRRLWALSVSNETPDTAHLVGAPTATYPMVVPPGPGQDVVIPTPLTETFAKLPATETGRRCGHTSPRSLARERIKVKGQRRSPPGTADLIRSTPNEVLDR